MQIYVQNIASYAPGLDDWGAMRAALAGESTYDDLPSQAIAKIVPQILPANERRRTTPIIKLALHVAEQLVQGMDDNVQLASVFASSDGDHDILDKSTHALTLPGHPVSPTNFHNSVHNAPAGYWAIAANSQAFSTSLAAGDASFTAGLLEAATFSLIEAQPVMLVAYDYPPYSILQTVRECRYPFAVALLLQAKQDDQTQYRLDITTCEEKETTQMQTPAFEALRKANPVARSLPLLEAIASETTTACSIEHVNNTCIQIKVQPCR